MYKWMKTVIEDFLDEKDNYHLRYEVLLTFTALLKPNLYNSVTSGPGHPMPLGELRKYSLINHVHLILFEILPTLN